MSRVIVVTNPSHDRATNYLDAWIKHVLSNISIPDVEIFELTESKATKENFEKLVNEKNPQLILFHGHGSPDSIMGFNYGVLVKCDSNLEILKDKIVHSLSCDSGKKMGPAAVKIGSVAFIGYKEEFKFIHLNKLTEQERLTDGIASLFLKPAFSAVTSLIKGDTIKEVYTKSQQESASVLRNLLTGVASTNVTIIASRVYHNLINQMYVGNENAKF